MGWEAEGRLPPSYGQAAHPGLGHPAARSDSGPDVLCVPGHCWGRHGALPPTLGRRTPVRTPGGHLVRSLLTEGMRAEKPAHASCLPQPPRPLDPRQLHGLGRKTEPWRDHRGLSPWFCRPAISASVQGLRRAYSGWPLGPLPPACGFQLTTRSIPSSPGHGVRPLLALDGRLGRIASGGPSGGRGMCTHTHLLGTWGPPTLPLDPLT